MSNDMFGNDLTKADSFGTPVNDEPTTETKVEANGARFYQHMRAPNDTNGNPRRLYVVYELQGMENKFPEAKIVQVVDEGYAGLPLGWRGMPEISTVDITATEYKNYLKKIYGDYEVIWQ